MCCCTSVRAVARARLCACVRACVLCVTAPLAVYWCACIRAFSFLFTLVTHAHTRRCHYTFLHIMRRSCRSCCSYSYSYADCRLQSDAVRKAKQNASEIVSTLHSPSIVSEILRDVCAAFALDRPVASLDVDVDVDVVWIWKWNASRQPVDANSTLLMAEYLCSVANVYRVPLSCQCPCMRLSVRHRCRMGALSR